MHGAALVQVFVLFVVFTAMAASTAYALTLAGWHYRARENATALAYFVAGITALLALLFIVSGAFSVAYAVPVGR